MRRWLAGKYFRMLNKTDQCQSGVNNKKKGKDMEFHKSGTALLFAALTTLIISACMPATEEAVTTPIVAAEPEQKQARFRSTKTISSVCNVYELPFIFPGFNQPEGVTIQEMPPALPNRLEYRKPSTILWPLGSTSVCIVG